MTHYFDITILLSGMIMRYIAIKNLTPVFNLYKLRLIPLSQNVHASESMKNMHYVHLK
jgi:hypothetical protein